MCFTCPGKTICSQTTDIEGGDLEDDEETEERLHQHMSNSTPDIHTIHTDMDKQEQRDSGVSDDSDIVQKFVKGAKFICQAVEDFTPSHDQPSCIPLRVSWKATYITLTLVLLMLPCTGVLEAKYLCRG